MSQIALLPRDSICSGRYLNNKKLPDNYMGDFTLMGFVVDRYDTSVSLLVSAGYQVDRLEAGADITIETPLDIQEIRDLLTMNQIHCDFSDIADTLYQA